MSYIVFTKVSGTSSALTVKVGGKSVGLIRKQGGFYILSAKDGSTFQTEGMRYSYAKTFEFRSDAQSFAREHWNPLNNQ